MAKQFPHIKDSEFPHVQNVDVYKYINEFDYSRYDYSQMELMICCVPWDMGEAHIGNRTISGIGNVVYFNTAEERDNWFASIPDDQCFRWESKFKELHRDNEIVVPLPFDVASKYNYLYVQYHLFANDSSPVEYENSEGLKRWFWFIREVEFLSPNSTKLHLMNDAWQTFIYDIDIPYMQLERGHAPLFETTADRYLENPLQNSQHLLSPDVDADASALVRRNVSNKVFDASDMYLVFAMTVDPAEGFGTRHTDSWHTHAQPSYVTNGIPNYMLVAIEAADYTRFCTAIDEYAPNVKQTIQAVFLAPLNLLAFGASFTFGETTCYHVRAAYTQTETMIDLDKSQFNYGARYANLAKLYTFPYAWIEITDENGNAQQIRIEETTGHIDVNYMLNAALPALNISAFITGATQGGAAIEFKTLENRNITIDGRSWSLQWQWAIPTFAVIQSADRAFDWNYYFEKKQQILDYQTAYNNATATNSTVKTNTDNLASTEYNNAVASALATKSNAEDAADIAYYAAKATNAQASSNKHAESYTMAAQLFEGARKTGKDVGMDNAYIAAGIQTEADKLAITSVNNSVGSIASGAFVGAAGGPAGAAAGAVTGAVNAAGSVANSIVSFGATSTMAQNQQNVNINKAQYSYSLNSWQATNIYGTAFTASGVGDTWAGSLGNFGGGLNYQLAHDAMVIGNLSADNSHKLVKGGNISQRAINSGTPSGYSSLDFTIPAKSLTGTAVRTYNTATSNALATKTTQNTNALNTKTTADANALRTQTNAQNAIDNRILDAGMNAPVIYNTPQATDSAITKPKMLMANVVTESPAGIAYAGDEFLRYGYALNQQWEFNGNWNIGKYFTYWKLSDFWVKGLNVPDMYMDKIRFFLFGGVTVWRNPDDIGRVSIYENGI